MKKSNFNKTKRIVVLLLLFLGMVTPTLVKNFLVSGLNKNIYSDYNDIFKEEDNFNELLPKLSEPLDFNGNGVPMNVTLHQSYLNNSFNTALNNSNTNDNKFTLPCPKDTNFNTSYTKFEIEDIIAPNKTIEIEAGTTYKEPMFFGDLHAFSFLALNSSILHNLSICFSEINLGLAEVKIRIYSAIYDGTEKVMKPSTNLNLIDITQSIPQAIDTVWYNFTINTNLDVSTTNNNTFFIVLYNSDPAGGRAQYHYENDADGTDNSETWHYTGGTWSIHYERDISSNLILGFNDNTPSPEEINLRINNKTVNNNIGNTGIWESLDEESNISGHLEYNFTANWWNVTCTVSKVQINYTKSNILANSYFDIIKSGDYVKWNVSVSSGLNYFDDRITHYNTINFSIPKTWDSTTIKVFNNTNEWLSSDINKNFIRNGYRDVQVLNAGNGTFWHLTANSTNLAASVDTYVSGIPETMVNHSNIVEINGTFDKAIFDGILNLNIFTPTPRYLNHTKVMDLGPLATDTVFHISDWDVSVNVTQYGVFKIQMSWNNDTAAGFLEDYITVVADTDLILSLPKITFNSGEIFNMTVFFNDTGQDLGIEADTLNYQIGSGPIRTDNIYNIGNGYYNITFDCNDADFIDYGINSINVNTYKDYYNNQTRTTSITILAETDAYIVYPLDYVVFDSGDSFDLQVFYNNTVKNVGITVATIEYSIDGGSTYIQENISPVGPGEYNITISASDSRFGGYGFKDIIVNCSKDYYYNQSNSVTVQFIGETSITTQKIPNKVYYKSAETFNISIFYRDTAKDIGVSGATIDVDVDGTVYNPPTWFDYGDGNYDVTIDCSDPIFSNYKTFSIRVNVSLINYYNQSDTLDTLIVGNVSLFTLAPSYGAIFIQDQSFDITVQYNDTILGVGIDSATIQYSLNDGASYKPDNVNSIGQGKYNITIDLNDPQFLRYGYVDILINASKQFYENISTTYTFHRQIRTQITSSESTDLGSVMKGLNVSYSFDYEEFYSSVLIEEANWTQLSSPVGFNSFFESYGNGTYTMHLDTTNVEVTGIPYVFEFSIYAIGNETQVIQLTIDVLIIETEVLNVSWISEIARNSGLNQSVRFYFNDTTNNLPVRGLTTSNTLIKDNGTGTLFNTGEYFLYDYWDNGTYILDITMGTRNSGWYTLQLNASRFPNYNWSLFYITFYYRGNFTALNLVSLSHPGGLLSPTGLANYTIFEGSDLGIVFNITDLEYFNELVIGDVNAYYAQYTNLITSATGILLTNLNFISQTHSGTIFTSNTALTPGYYLINLTTSKTNYENGSLLFNLTIIEKYQVNISVIYKPLQVNAGTGFEIIIQAEYFNGTIWLPIDGTQAVFGTGITITPYFNGNADPSLGPILTNSSGQAFFEITLDINVLTMNLTIYLDGDYYHISGTIYEFGIEVIPFEPGLTFEDLIPYLILIGAVLAIGGSVVGVYRGVVVPKKREKKRMLSEVKTIFDDAINLEHILVLYKETGTCVYFKSYGSEQIDPELIGGFLTAVSSFGREMVAQEALNEISYGDKMLLLADGEYIRIALVLTKKASLILRRNLKEFISVFEKTYKDVLPNWRGQLAHFRTSGQIVDDLLSTSIILPHQISYDFSSIKELKNPHSKEVLKIAHSCCEEADRQFFFIATLLKEASERTNKDTAEIFMGIKELRDKKMLIPIEISALEAQPISQQEINLINQKVSQLTTLSPEEKQKLVNDLAQVGPAEREAYLSSITERHKIVSAPIKSKIGTIEIANKKEAKNGIKELFNRAKKAKSKKNYQKSIEIFQEAALIASNWELSKEFMQLEEFTRKIKIEDLTFRKKQFENEAKLAVKKKNYLEAAQKYKQASKIASEVFKLGVTGMTKEVKRLTNKANEYEKLKS